MWKNTFYSYNWPENNNILYMLLHFVTRTNDQIYRWSNQKHLKSPNCKLCQKKEDIYIYHLYIDCKMNKKICNHFQKYYKYLIKKEHTPLQQYVFGLPSAKIYLYPFFTTKHKFFTSKNAIFNINTHTHFFTLFNQKTPIKVGIQGKNLYIFL